MEKFNAESLFKMVSEIVAEVTIGKRAEDGEAKTFQVHPKDMTLPALEYVIRYGIQRGVNDKCGGSDKTLADKIETAEEIILSWYEGTLRTRKNAAEKLSDYDSFARKYIINLIPVEKRKELAATEDKGAAYIAKVLAANLPKYEEAIKAKYAAHVAEMAEKAKLAEGLDLDV